jgi:hypothetical protein
MGNLLARATGRLTFPRLLLASAVLLAVHLGAWPLAFRALILPREQGSAFRVSPSAQAGNRASWRSETLPEPVPRQGGTLYAAAIWRPRLPGRHVFRLAPNTELAVDGRFLLAGPGKRRFDTAETPHLLEVTLRAGEEPAKRRVVVVAHNTATELRGCDLGFPNVAHLNELVGATRALRCASAVGLAFTILGLVSLAHTRRPSWRTLWPWLRPSLGNLALLLTSMLAVLVCLEIAVRLSNGMLTMTRSFRSRQLDIFQRKYAAQPDPVLGYRPAPNWNRRTLEHGLRSNGTQARASGDGATILCVGDSFTWGDDAEDAETWPAQLERLSGTRTLNGGVFGYGVDQIVLRSRELVDIYHPRLVIVGLIQDDVERCALAMRDGAYKPYFKLCGGELVLYPPPFPQPGRELGTVRRLGAYSLLVHSLMMRVDPLFWLNAKHRSVYGERGGLDQATAVACRLLGDLVSELRTQGIETVLLFQYAPLPRDARRIFAHIESCLGGVAPLIDLHPSLSRMQATAPERYAALYLPSGHMSAAGNRFVAEAVASHIKRNPLRYRPPPRHEADPGRPAAAGSVSGPNDPRLR